MPSRSNYQWTAGRLAGGAVIVLAGIVVVGYAYARFRSGEGPSPEAFASAIDRLGRVRMEQGLAAFNIEDLRVSGNAILPGGPPKDGIPAITEPATVPVGEAGFLDDGERVIGVRVDGVSRAYPIKVLLQHELVNDVVGDVPIGVIYCPLCDSVSIVDRRIDDTVREFGVSGLLLNSNVLLFDRGDDSLWTQVGFAAISGPRAGRTLAHMPWSVSSFGAWRAAHPEGTVMTVESRDGRDYERRPYEAYFRTDQLYFPVRGRDGRLSPKTRIVGVEVDGVARAYPVAAIHAAPERRVIDDVGGATIELAAGPAPGDVEVVRMPTGARVVHTFWFAWAAFHEGTEVWGGESTGRVGD